MSDPRVKASARPGAPATALVFAFACSLAGPARALAEAPAAGAVPPRPSAGCARTEIARGDRLDRTIDVGGVERTFVLDAPAGLEPGRPVPLLLDFHGIGHSGGGVWRVSEFRGLARRSPFVTAYPDGLPVRLETPRRTFEGRGWEVRKVDGNRDLAFVRALLDRLEAEYCIDRARVYATGFSNGGYLSHLLACTMADRFAAIAPVSGGVLPIACEPSRPVPVIIHHGRQDELIDVAQARRARDAWLRTDACPLDAAGDASPAPTGEPAARTGRAVPSDPRDAASTDAADLDPDAITCSAVRDCRDGTVVEYCEGDFAHTWPASATERIWEFLLAHPLPAARP